VAVAIAFWAMLSAFDRGSLTTVAVIASQYPAVTIVLVALLWKQRPRGVQYLGVTLALVAVALIAAG
jgi:drug/metabolite transporter (DMT)-like permease